MTKYKTTRNLESFNPELVELVQQSALKNITVPCKDEAQAHSLKMRCYQIRRLLGKSDHPNKALILRTAFRVEGSTVHCGLADQDVESAVSAALKKAGVGGEAGAPSLDHLAEDPYKI